MFTTELLSFAEENYRPVTQWIYENDLKRLQDIVGDLTLNNLTALHWDQYKTHRLQKVSPLRTNIEFRSLRSAPNR
jgi:hypothetical protein